MENRCLNCGKPVKNKYCNVSCQNMHQWTGKKRSKKNVEAQKRRIRDNWKNFIVACFKCGKEITIKEYKTDFPKKGKYYCSRICANSRSWSIEDKNKKSKSAKESDKVKLANIKIGENRKDLYKIERIVSKCLYCGEDIIHKITKKRKYHSECWLKCSGGIKKGSSRGKCGWYKNYWCDSSYELAWIIFNIDHNIDFKRNYEGFNYVFNNETHKYYPDFILKDGLYVEIKNYHSELTDAKLKQFAKEIKILYKEDIKKEILPYVISNYGKDFVKLYELKAEAR